MRGSAALAYKDPLRVGEPDNTAWNPVTRLTNANPWLDDALKSLLPFVDMSNDWDGYGSPAPSRQVVATCLAILKSLAIDEPPLPRIQPVPGGGIQLEWSERDKFLEVEILPNSNVQFLAIPGPDQVIEGNFPIERDDLLRTLVRCVVPIVSAELRR